MNCLGLFFVVLLATNPPCVFGIANPDNFALVGRESIAV
jgi:hypothetical protein